MANSDPRSFELAGGLNETLMLVYTTDASTCTSRRMNQTDASIELGVCLMESPSSTPWPVPDETPSKNTLDTLNLLIAKYHIFLELTSSARYATGQNRQTIITSESAAPAQASPIDTDTMSEAFQILGFMGSLLLAASLVPQMRKLYKTKSAKDISLVYQISYVVGLAMIVAYGFGRWLWPVYIPATIELCAAIVVFSMKLYYDAQDRKRDCSKNAGASPEVEVDVASAASRSQCGEATRA